MRKKIIDLLFDGIDASSEVDKIGEKYIDIFLELPSFKLDSFFCGEKFLIYGNKGSGLHECLALFN
ncbi:MAG: hypothetical protein IJE45_02980 [Bacilli bacterium]|nr:hypothetical protein [Bacilli bacterium]